MLLLRAPFSYLLHDVVGSTLGLILNVDLSTLYTLSSIYQIYLNIYVHTYNKFIKISLQLIILPIPQFNIAMRMLHFLITGLTPDSIFIRKHLSTESFLY